MKYGSSIFHMQAFTNPSWVGRAPSGAMLLPSKIQMHRTRRFVIMGFSYERGVGEMLENMGHRAEFDHGKDI